MSRSTRPSRAARRFGYFVAILCNVGGIYVANHLLAWGWPRFLTPDFQELLPIVNLSFIASILANGLFIIGDAKWFRSMCDAVTASVSFVVALRTWQVFPFDFSDYARDWSPLFRVVLVLAMVGTAIAVVVNAVTAVVAVGHPHGRADATAH
jgi:hypothetical protein